MILLASPTRLQKQLYIYLPNPVLSNAIAVDAEINLRRAMDGTPYTYVKVSDTRTRITMQFERVGYGRTQSMSDFFRILGGDTFDLVDHNEDSWLVRFNQPEFDFTVAGRSGPEGADGMNTLRSEHCSFELLFVGEPSG